jgi:serine/threonine protein kinase
MLMARKQATMKQNPTQKNYQQPTLSENQLLIKPVDAAVCPEAVYLLQQIRHPALPALRGVELLAVGRQEVQPCFLFDFLPGTSLDRLSAAERADWTLTQQLHYFAELARVLEFLHSQGEHGLMHLDIKPGNLLLGPDLRPYLIDFDAMRFAENPDDSIDLSPLIDEGEREQPADEGAIAGTPGYAAPEVLQGKPCPASDLYALGLTLLHVLTGYEPLPDNQATVSKHLKTLPAEVAAMISRCLMSQPEQRYQNAGELASQLDRAVQRLKQVTTATVNPATVSAAPESEQTGPAAVSAEPAAVPAAPTPTPSRQTGVPAGPVPTSSGRESEPIGPAAMPTEENRMASELKHNLARLLCIWDGAEFGCELAVQLRKYYARVLVIDGDLIGPQADLLLGKRPRKNQLLQIASFDNLNQAMAEIARGTLTSSRLKDLVWPSLIDQVDLMVFGANLDEYDHVPPESLLKLLEVARLSYPVIVLLCNRFIYDAFTCLGLMTADQVLIPLAGHAASFRAFNRSIDFLALRRQLDPDRTSFVAFPYDERNDLSLGTLDVLSSGRLIGSVQTCFARQRQRGSAKPYACSVSSVNEKEYDGIIARLNHLNRKEHPDADHHVTRPFRRTIRLLSRQTAATQ